MLERLWRTETRIQHGEGKGDDDRGKCSDGDPRYGDGMLLRPVKWNAALRSAAEGPATTSKPETGAKRLLGALAGLGWSVFCDSKSTFSSTRSASMGGKLLRELHHLGRATHDELANRMLGRVKDRVRVQWRLADRRRTYRFDTRLGTRRKSNKGVLIDPGISSVTPIGAPSFSSRRIASSIPLTP